MRIQQQTWKGERERERERENERTNDFFINEGNGISAILFLHPTLGPKEERQTTDRQRGTERERERERENLCVQENNGNEEKGE